jgi:hypothetical protein
MWSTTVPARVACMAVRGNPKTRLFNVHLDTVPTRRTGAPIRTRCA